MSGDHHTHVEPVKSLAEFDRRMAFYTAATDASRSREDSYLEAASTPSLRDDSKRQRRWLILASVATILVTRYDIKPTTVAALGLELSGAKERIIVFGTGVFTIFFLIEFIAFARRDHSFWRQRVAVTYRRLCAALEQEGAQIQETFRQSSAADHLMEGVEARQVEYKIDPNAQTGTWWVWALSKTFTGLIEFLLPVIIAFVALALWLMRVGGEF